MLRPVPKLLLLISAWALACKPHDRKVEVFAVRDSAGVEIVETNVGALDSSYAWELDTANALEVTAPDSILAMTSWSFDVVVQTPGGYIVSPGVGLALRVFDSLGHFVRMIGRQGRGPGEFLFVRAVSAMPGDSVLVIDDEKMTASVVDVLSGKITEQKIVRPDGVFGADYIGRFTDGSTAWDTGGWSNENDATTATRLFRMKPNFSASVGPLSNPLFMSHTRPGSCVTGTQVSHTNSR